MKRLLKLTAIPHPDINGGEPYPVYVDPEHIVMIERGKKSQERYGWHEEQQNLTLGFWDELQRCNGELRDVPSMAVDSEQSEAAFNRWMRRKDVAASMQAAYGLISAAAQKPLFYPPQEATCIQLAVPNARFTMLPIVYVTESPEEVAARVTRIP